MTKKLRHILAPVLALSMAASLLAGCGSSDSGTSTAETTQGSATTETTASSGGETSGGATASAKDTLILATANETPSLTTNLH